MTCGHWSVGDSVPCGQRAVVLVVASDDSETWRGGLCAAHLAEYMADPEFETTIVRRLA